tara:strand:- start:518 stop:1357 length:840 start_codon:yes stop_codon:yes gene_type:complete
MNGTIGSALLARLQADGVSVMGTTQRPDAVLDQHAMYLNLQDPSSWHVDRRVDVVYLCAGICRMSLCEEDPLGTLKINVDATLALARQLAKQGAFVVYLSTNQVFSGQKAYAEADGEYGPQNEYGRQKAKIESLLTKHIPSLAIVRLTKVVEPHFPLIQGWIQALLQNQSVRAFTDMVLAPVSLRQVVATLVKIGQGKKSGVYQISGAEDVSYFDLASYLAQKLGRPRELILAANAAEGGMKETFLPRFTTLDCSSIIATFGENPPHYREVLQECFALA